MCGPKSHPSLVGMRKPQGVRGYPYPAELLGNGNCTLTDSSLSGCTCSKLCMGYNFNL